MSFFYALLIILLVLIIVSVILFIGMFLFTILYAIISFLIINCWIWIPLSLITYYFIKKIKK